MAMDSTLRRAGDFNFVEFLLDAARAAGGEFHATDEQGRRGEVGLAHFHARVLRIMGGIGGASAAALFLEEDEVAEQCDVAEAGLCAAIDREAFGPLERAVDERDVQLKRDPREDVVAE